MDVHVDERHGLRGLPLGGRLHIELGGHGLVFLCSVPLPGPRRSDPGSGVTQMMPSTTFCVTSTPPFAAFTYTAASYVAFHFSLSTFSSCSGPSISQLSVL